MTGRRPGMFRTRAEAVTFFIVLTVVYVAIVLAGGYFLALLARVGQP